MTNVISFSLYGNSLKYQHGAVLNAKGARQYYPHWNCRFYCGESISESTKIKIRSFGAETVDVDGREDPSAMFWRFRPVLENGINTLIVRDCDSRFSDRELFTVNEWLSSESNLHIMRDHPSHNAPILGGLWGAKTDVFDLVASGLENYRPRGEYGEDQRFLARSLYSSQRQSSFVHDSFFWREPQRKKFPTKRISGFYVGESVDENEYVSNSLREQVVRIERSFIHRTYVGIRDYMDALIRNDLS